MESPWHLNKQPSVPPARLPPDCQHKVFFHHHSHLCRQFLHQPGDCVISQGEELPIHRDSKRKQIRQSSSQVHQADGEKGCACHWSSSGCKCSEVPAAWGQSHLISSQSWHFCWCPDTYPWAPQPHPSQCVLTCCSLMHPSTFPTRNANTAATKERSWGQMRSAGPVRSICECWALLLYKMPWRCCQKHFVFVVFWMLANKWQEHNTIFPRK